MQNKKIFSKFTSRPSPAAAAQIGQNSGRGMILNGFPANKHHLNDDRVVPMCLLNAVLMYLPPPYHPPDSTPVRLITNTFSLATMRLLVWYSSYSKCFQKRYWLCQVRSICRWKGIKHVPCRGMLVANSCSGDAWMKVVIFIPPLLPFPTSPEKNFGPIEFHY